MSDLHRAVEGEIDAFRPDRIPPFAAVLDRHRARSRRRYATGAAALSAVAVAGVVLVPPALSGGTDQLPSYAGPDSTRAPASDLAVRLCATAAQGYDGEVAAAYDTTVQTVRDYMTDPYGSRAGMTGAPRSGVSGPYSYPAGWPEKAPDDPAAACYIDAAIPTPGPPGSPAATRALVMTTEGAGAFMATAGPKESLPPAPLTEPAQHDSGLDRVAYGITYADAATYEKHEQAVEACFALPGVSDVRSRASMPPLTSLNVTGVRENAAFRDCISRLDGVVLQQHSAPTAPTAPSPEAALWGPESFAQRRPLPSCGSFDTGFSGEAPPEGAACLSRAVGSTDGAELVVTFSTFEGDPITLYYRALPGEDAVEVFEDRTRDELGSQSWSRSLCTGFDAETGQATGCAEADL